jgi:hypothetical protein
MYACGSVHGFGFGFGFGFVEHTDALLAGKKLSHRN